MASLLIAALAALLPTARGSPTPSIRDYQTYPDWVHPSNGKCVDYNVSSTITYPAFTYVYPTFQDDHDVDAFLFNMTTKDATLFNSFQPLNPVPQNKTSTFIISATFCSPKNQNGKEDTVLVATHGAGYDRRYWASSFQPEKYNFAQAALDTGYSVFYYDRLGLGRSARVNGFESSTPAQARILVDMVDSIKAGTYTSDIKASKVVLVGHSLGSYISNGALSLRSDLVDVAVLTGMSYPAATDPAGMQGLLSFSFFGSRIAAQLEADRAPQLAKTYDTGYISFGDKFRHIQTFFHHPDYDYAAADYAQSITAPTSASELVSTLALTLASPGYKGKVLITSGQYDFLSCDGNCTDTYAKGKQADVFPNANWTTYAHPGAGHGSTLSLNATGYYDYILNYIDSSL